MAFYDADIDEKLLVNLFNGWGYNFYRLENQLRADDLMVRARICDMLGAARAGVAAAEAAYRHEYLPPPSREKPRPDAEALRNARALEEIGQSIGALEGQIRSLPVPENDRMTQRFREERDTLKRLAAADRALVGRAEQLRSMLADPTATWLIENIPALTEAISGVKATLQERGDVLTRG